MNFKNTIFFCGMTVLLSFLILNCGSSGMTYQSSFAAQQQQQQNMNTN